jgi:hypothetical protein
MTAHRRAGDVVGSDRRADPTAAGRFYFRFFPVALLLLVRFA